MSDEICRIAASKPRRFFMLGVLAALGAILIWIGFRAGEGGLFLQLAFIAAGGVIFALMPRLLRATNIQLVLTEEGLAEDGGRMLARFDEIDRVERGAFAFKPSNGFMVHLRAPGPRGWEPGIWWRIGTRLAIGGVIPASQSKLMADIMTAKLKGSSLF